MCAIHGDHLLVRPGATEFSLAFNQKARRFRIDEQLWYGACRQPARVRLNYLDDVLRFAFNRQLSRPGKHWHAGRPRDSPVTAIHVNTDARRPPALTL